MDVLAPFRIPIATLKADEANYTWDLGSDFLTIFDQDHEQVKGVFRVEMNLHRAAGIINLDFAVTGSIDTTCDRCLAPITLPIVAEYQMIVKYGDPDESNDEVIFIALESPVLNVGQHIYDFIQLSVPITHRIEDCETLRDQPCDLAVLSYLTENQIFEMPRTDDDSPWNELKKVSDN